MKETGNTIIESLGIYLPPDAVSTAEVLKGCKIEVKFPLEKVSGIQTRRMAGIEEFSIDLARKAIADCLSRSKYGPGDIDLFICCNISRFDKPEAVSFEPCTSVRLRRHFGFEHAVVFDITNACAGMFTGIYIAHAYLKTGAARRAMVVSGEYITHLTNTAQREITKFMDSRLACLTVGDAGAAIILEKSGESSVGFVEMDLHTYGRYSSFCIAKASEQGGWIMHTDSVNLTNEAMRSCTRHSLDTMARGNWQPGELEHLIMHQTSKMTLDSAANEINHVLKRPIFHEGNTVNNLEQRGNTASTSHFVALWDLAQQGRLNTGDRVVFSISASGLTVGTALYVFDNLPDRLRQPTPELPGMEEQSAGSESDGRGGSAAIARVRVEAIGTVAANPEERRHSLDLLQDAVSQCLDMSVHAREDVGVLMYAGVYRSEYMMEPALAALLAGKIDMNAAPVEAESRTTLAFDVFNGALGFLNACHAAQQMVLSGACKAAMVVASECENNLGMMGEELMGVSESASAVMLDVHPGQGAGFSRFHFHHEPDSEAAYTVWCSTRDAGHRLLIEKAPDLHARYLAAILPAVERLLEQEGIGIQDIDRVFPPQISHEFIALLSTAMNLPLDRFVDVAVADGDLFSSSLPFGLDSAFSSGLPQHGGIGLLIAVGSGIQVGCAIYRF